VNNRPVAELFQEYADAFASGEEPRAIDYLARADDSQRQALAELIERFVAAAPVRQASLDSAALLGAWVDGESSLLALRTGRRLKRSDVVDALITALKLDPAKREKVRTRYHELETGQLEPERVDRRVWDALATTLRTRSEELLSWAPGPPKTFGAGLAFYRIADDSARGIASAAPDSRPEPDEIDRLFGVGAADL
jgi:hypothetical protein